MKKPYELTVIISNYNQEKYISETINSVFMQQVNFSFKVIITDDYSCKDRSREIIQDYTKKYTNIEPIFAEENKGYLSNIMRAKAITKTKYFCLLDADDYWTDLHFLQRAYDYLESHDEYSIYEANVDIMKEDGSQHPFISPKQKSGSYSKDMFLNNEPVPITQTTGMVFRNSIFSHGVPEIMRCAVGTISERSFEGDTGRFIMHLKEGLAYYDAKIVGVYRLTEDGIWNSLSNAKKQIIAARMQLDFFKYYDSNVDFFVRKAYKYLQAYLSEKQKELTGLNKQEEFLDEYEVLMINDVYRFCKQYESQIVVEKHRIKEKAKQILNVLRE